MTQKYKRPARVRVLRVLIKVSKRCRLRKAELQGFIWLGQIEDGY